MTHLTGAALDDAVADIVNQFVTVGKHTWDPRDGALPPRLRRFARDVLVRFDFGAVGPRLVPGPWGGMRMAIVETMQYLGKNDATRPMQAILERIYDVLPKYADPRTGDVVPRCWTSRGARATTSSQPDR